MYANALAEATAVRKALAVPKPSPNVLKAVRTAVADFESVVRQYPSSSYCDDALWHAANLAKAAFEAFSEPRESTAAARLFRLLSSEYPTSKFARQVPVQLKSLDASIASSRSKQNAAVSTAPSLPQPAVQPPAVPAEGATPVASSDLSPSSTQSSPVSAPALTPAPATTPPPAASIAAQASIKDIRRAVLPDVVRVVIELDREVTFHNERLDGPDRVFVDLAPTRADFKLIDRTLRFDGDTDVVGQIRIGRHPNNVTRVVLDAEGVSSYSVYPLYSPFRLVIDCLRDTTTDSHSAVAVPSSAPTSPAQAAPRAVVPAVAPAVPPSVVPAVAATVAAPAVAAMALPPPATAPAVPTPASPSSSAPPVAAAPAKGSASLSMARQLGLGVSRIVIDPGHGGHDPGAKGPGLTEAELVLDVALRLEKLLEKIENVEVVLTRRGNDFVPLEERTAIANREGADLFLSIHVNASSSPSARGVETYYLDFATTQSAAAVAARENATSNKTMGSLQDVVKEITLNSKLDESRDFAERVHREMVGTLRSANRNVRDLGVKQAPFVVLIGATMPSVLAEVSFLSNADEAKLLKSGAYRQRIAQALFDGLKNYQHSLKPWAAVAQQQD